ncbi:MAG: hypothetical protein IKV17_05215 [Bacteroidaceae bacterium]|nr:hypothetical protein [Bacteroidaceae bacterium]
MKRTFSLMLLIASITCLSSCLSENDKSPSNIPTEHFMAVGENFNLEYKSNWKSSNTFAATVDKEGVITAVRVGEAKIYSTKEDLSCNVYIYPSYSLYSDPITEGGISKNEVKELLGTPYSEKVIGEEEGGEIIVYETNNNIAPFELYMFANDSLIISAVGVNASYSEKLTTHLSQQYKFLNYNEAEEIISFIDAETIDEVNTIVTITPYPNYPNLLLVMYILNPNAEDDIETKATRSGSNLFDKISSELLPVNISQEAK